MIRLKNLLKEQPEDPKQLSQVNLTSDRTFKDPNLQKIYDQYRAIVKELDALHQQYGHNVKHKLPIPEKPNKSDLQNLLSSVKKQLQDDRQMFEKAYEYSAYIPKTYWTNNNLTVWDFIDSSKGLAAMRANYNNLPAGVFRDYYSSFGKRIDPNARELTKQEIEKLKMSGGKTNIGKLPGEDAVKSIVQTTKDLAKDFYYNFLKSGKSCNIEADNKDDAFFKAKKAGCNYFNWNGKWYNTETDMPIDQELKAYAQKNFTNYVVVDYFAALQSVGGGLGHIQAWSLTDTEYQINPMPLNADIRSIIPYDTESIGIHNMAIEELNQLNKESIVLKMSDSEYEHFKKTVGLWKGRKRKWLEKALKDPSISDNIKSWFDNYNIIFNNCSHATVQAVIPTSNKITRMINTIPWEAYQEIKKYYQGRFEERTAGIRFEKLSGVGDQVPAQYQNPEYVIKNAETIVANKWTVAVQQTLWAQYDMLRSNSADTGSGVEYKKAAEAVKKMHDKSFVQNGNKWDKTFGPDTKAALQAIRNIKSQYKLSPITAE